LQDEDLTARQPAKLSDIEEYAESTASQLLYMQLQCAGVVNVHADHAASHIGIKSWDNHLW